jgi:hypothetical protein
MIFKSLIDLIFLLFRISAFPKMNVLVDMAERYLKIHKKSKLDVKCGKKVITS